MTLGAMTSAMTVACCESVDEPSWQRDKPEQRKGQKPRVLAAKPVALRPPAEAEVTEHNQHGRSSKTQNVDGRKS
jgi:hypothetical protein